MRLGQLARKLALKPSQLADFLAAKNIPAESGINTRLEIQHVQLIVNSFAPDRLTEILEEETKENEPETMAVPLAAAPVAEVKSEEIAEKKTDEPAPSPEAVHEVMDLPVAVVEETKEEAEVIKAPKVELQGLKVLGKIELPEVKKKEVAPKNTEEAGTEASTRAKQERRPAQRRERSEQRPYRNPIAQQREQEALEAERKRKEQAELNKEKRTQNYLKRVKSAPTKAVRRVDEPLIEMTEEETPAPPKTWLGKLLRWFKS